MSEHLSETQLTAYSGRTLPPQELLAVDNHLASCDECHERLTRILPATAKLALSQSTGFGEPFHLDYEQHLEPYVDGRADDIDREIVDSHVALCSKCATDLNDLLAFKQQRVPAISAGARVTSARWKRWLPQWPALSNPALATAVVIVVFIVAMAVLLWTTKLASQPGQQAGSPASDKEQPSAAPTEHTAETDEPPTQPSPREEPLIALNDAGGELRLNQSGHLEGFHELPADLRESVERALTTRQLRASPALTGWPTGAGNLRSAPDQQSTFAPLEPTDVVVETDRPAFRWRALEGAEHYTVTIYDSQLRQVGNSGPVTGTEWTTPTSLARGVVYSWQISALKDGEKVVSPKPPLPEARFRILDHRAVVTLAKLKENGSSHLALAVFYWKHGLLEKSEREFQALAKANPNSTAVAELLASIRSLRRR